jgi:ABC-2 type transport system permease protein
MVTVGAAVTKVQEAQQVAGLLNMLFILPIIMMVVIIQNPGHPLAVFLTLFPTTAFLTISIRWGLGTVPLWQIGIGWVLLIATTITMLWAAARVFRAGMLRYGQPLNLKAAVAVIRGD